MNRSEIIQRFCAIVNDGLAQGEDYGNIAYEQLTTSAGGLGEKSLLDLLHQNYYAALRPDKFFNVKISKPDEDFELSYELLRNIFDESELGPREAYLVRLASQKKEQGSTLTVRIGRFWQALGPQQYDTSGQLKEFAFNPLVLTKSVMSVIAGTYMHMELPQRKHESLAAIGHLATRSHFRRGQGHGSNLLKAFEQAVERIAAERGNKLQLIVLESQAGACEFWAKQGYRWPAGSRYAQPPLEFDPISGERFHDEVPEYLMIKLCNDPEAKYIDSKLLTDAVYTMYQNWYLKDRATYTPEAAKRATDYVLGKIFAEFVASLPPRGEPVRLEEPSRI